MPLAIIAQVAGLPAGPATEATVRTIAGITDNLDDAALTFAINVTNGVVVDLRISQKFIATIDPAAPDNAWPQRIIGGATLLASRVFARRNSPEGVSAMADEGAVYIQRNDPDVAMMLKLGTAREPAIG